MNEVMRLMCGNNSWATEVVLLEKLGGNEVFVDALLDEAVKNGFEVKICKSK